LSTPTAPFGGVKASGIGREGGREGMSEYQELKYICLGIDE
ncbi:aldehyde dehydrogenase family protein, partial [bacterium]|nr:aldehyde dehydrogenase family protein [bacterium]